MVLVRVAEHDGVDPPVPRRDPLVEVDEQAVRVRPAVDQQPTAARSFDEDGIALPDVEDRHASRSPAGRAATTAPATTRLIEQAEDRRAADGVAGTLASRGGVQRGADASRRTRRRGVRRPGPRSPAPPRDADDRAPSPATPPPRSSGRLERDARERQARRGVHDRDEDPQDHPARRGDDGPDDRRRAGRRRGRRPPARRGRRPSPEPRAARRRGSRAATGSPAGRTRRGRSGASPPARRARRRGSRRASPASARHRARRATR